MTVMKPSHTRADFDHSPMIVFYETTRACDLACKHCRANAQRECDPDELSTTAARKLIVDLTRFPKPPLLVLTGGDPIKRRDVFDLIAFAREQKLEVAMTPSATPLVTTSVIRRLKEAGLHRLAVSLDVRLSLTSTKRRDPSRVRSCRLNCPDGILGSYNEDLPNIFY